MAAKGYRKFNPPPDSERCQHDVSYVDKRGGRCMRRAVLNGLCHQHLIAQPVDVPAKLSLRQAAALYRHWKSHGLSGTALTRATEQLADSMAAQQLKGMTPKTVAQVAAAALAIVTKDS